MSYCRAVATISVLGLAALAGCVAPPAQTQYVAVPQQVACDTSFRVVNNSGGTIERLYFSSANQNGWGNDQLGQNVLSSGRSTSFRAANTGNYDFRVVWQNGQAAELRGVNICAASTITASSRGLSAS